MARDDALEDLRRAQIEASKEAQRLTEAHDDEALESNAKVRRLEGEHAKRVSQLKHAEATISEYIVVSTTAQLDSVVNEQRVVFELEAKSLREQLQGNTTRVAQLQEALTVSLERVRARKGRVWRS